MENSVVQTSTPQSPLGGLKTFSLGILFFAVALYFYSSISNFENGEAVRMNRLLVLAYTMIGKNLTTCLLTLGGALYAYTGINEMIASRRF